MNLIAPSFHVTLLGLAIFYVMLYATPGLLVRLQSMPWTSRPRDNLDLDLQTVIYATYHTRWLNHATHWLLIVDQVAWFVLFEHVHPAVAGAALALLAVQAVLLADRALAVLLGLVWTACAAVAFLARRAAGDAAVPAAEMFLMVSAALRVLGHAAEPLPPLMANPTTFFVPIRAMERRPIVLLFPIFGYLSELAAGLPFRLIVVQIAWLGRRLGVGRALPWADAAAIARDIHARGWSAYPKIARLVAPHLAGSARVPTAIANRPDIEAKLDAPLR
ncbi:hypothetical protein A7982_12938 [Minicystis rosea]|nr:hypothetical protein A7982_12938 [Minicystis rosea]